MNSPSKLTNSGSADIRHKSPTGYSTTVGHPGHLAQACLGYCMGSLRAPASYSFPGPLRYFSLPPVLPSVSLTLLLRVSNNSLPLLCSLVAHSYILQCRLQPDGKRRARVVKVIDNGATSWSEGERTRRMYQVLSSRLVGSGFVASR
jgi:hypothetical protein